MKKFCYKILKHPITTIIIIIAIVCGIIKHGLSCWTADEVYNIVSMVTSIATCVIAIATLIYTALSNEENQEERKSEREKDVLYQWYNTLVMGQNLDDLLEMFQNSYDLITVLEKINSERSKIIGEEYDEKIKNSVITPFTQKYTSVQQKITRNASVIDENFSKSLQKQFESFQDAFLNQLSSYTPDYTGMQMQVLNMRYNMLKCIKDYNIQLIN